MEQDFHGDFQVLVTCFFASFSGVLDWIVLILVWFERSLHSAQVSEESCPWPLRLMTSQWVERTWIRTGGYGRFRGEWVKGLKPCKRETSAGRVRLCCQRCLTSNCTICLILLYHVLYTVWYSAWTGVCSGTVHAVIYEVDNSKTGLNRSGFNTCVASVPD